ncbi:hypothetical protein EIP91_004555 [Steccherinum ochraceum]|uniref:glutathione transferase n=1 Tax=Steccherinum ochraceum TaxID=92696 RepID=A0A4R0RBN5_9APHY|nr:hypothetical protein EIP91_004555 [Steccherinum ochraceum]
MLSVHHLNDSRSQRILWLLEELEVPYEIKKYQREPEGFAPKELLDVHPLGLAPIITDGDATMAESGAIVEFIIDKYGQGRAQAAGDGKLHDLYFKHYTEGSLMPLLVNRLVYGLVPDRAPFLVRPLARMLFNTLTELTVTSRLVAHGAFLEAHFEKGNKQWVAGGDGPTVGDYMLFFALEFWGLEALGPNLKAYLQRVHDRPAYKRAIERGGEFKLQ